jgi:nitroimidazol reductase NimA-like FMN-containing flavoprotein (pyridoxamine 5'-phosphate oxidase superfamily)
MLGELTQTQIDNVLSSQVIGRLGCCNGKQPYIVPVTFAYDGECIYGQTNEGTKLDMLRKNPNVCFEVDWMTDMRNWQSVIVFGKFEELKNEDAVAAKEILFNKVYLLQTSSTIHAHEHAVTAEIDDHTRVKLVMYRIVIDKITGRFEN